jgi:hypothetical protein
MHIYLQCSLYFKFQGIILSKMLIDYQIYMRIEQISYVARQIFS